MNMLIPDGDGRKTGITEVLNIKNIITSKKMLTCLIIDIYAWNNN